MTDNNAIAYVGKEEKTVRHKTKSMQIIAGFIAVISAITMITGCLTLAVNSIEVYAIPLLFTLFLLLTILFFVIRYWHQKTSFAVLFFAFISLASVITIMFLPQYLQWSNINGIIHRSLISGVLELVVAVPAACYSTYYFFGATPRADDISKYPIIVFCTVFALSAYAFIICQIIFNAIPYLNWSLFTTPFSSQYRIIEVWQNGWPTFSTQELRQAGILNHILGTLLLMGLTSMIALPIGVSVGIYVHEYAGPKLAWIINFSTTALRSISGVILAVTALSILGMSRAGTFFYKIIHGFGYDVNGSIQIGRSSYLFASFFISLLVIPLIARATQEGLGSLPREIREGSTALGVSREHTLFHIQLPWSFPNILTGLVLGCAEAAGSLTIMFLIAGTGQFGVGPLNETTSLAYLIFDCRYGKSMGDQVQSLMGSYQYAAALVLLIITIGLTATALILKNKLAKRYKGA
jgi:phosphate transport system permease protein